MVKYAGQPRVCHVHQHFEGSKTKLLLELQECFSCKSPVHIGKNCPHPLNLARSAAQNLDYLNKKKNASTVHMVLADVCYQIDKNGTPSSDTKIFLSFMWGENTLEHKEDHKSDRKSQDGGAVLKSTQGFDTNGGSFNGLCVDSGVQETVFGLD